MDYQGLDVPDAVRSLPRVHLLLLRGALVGFNEVELATLVGVPRESVRPLLRVAAAKLGSCFTDSDPYAPPDPDPGRAA